MPGQPGKDVEKGGAQQGSKPGRLMRCGIVSPTGQLVLAGSFLLVMLALVPMWNAVSLLGDFNYVFWAGRRVPHNMIIVLLLFGPFYALTSGIFFSRARTTTLSSQIMMLIATTFITLFGLFLMIASAYLIKQAEVTSTNLLYNCQYSTETHRLYEYSQVLQNIRQTPDCALQVSVESCAGYKESAPYTNILKKMETDFKCAGFCYHSSATSPVTSLMATAQHVKPQHTDHVTLLSLTAESSETGVRAGSSYPPTLFSDANYQASCESMAARDMQNYAGDIGIATYYQGLYLVLIAVATGFLELLGYCFQAKQSSKQ